METEVKTFTDEEINKDFFLKYISKKRRNVTKKFNKLTKLQSKNPGTLNS